MSITMTLIRIDRDELVGQAAAAVLDPYMVDVDPYGTHFDLGKAWSAISALIAPSIDLLAGDELLLEFDEDHDYGPPALLRPGSTQRVYAAISDILAGDPAKAVHDTVREGGFYPDVWHAADAVTWIVNSLREMQTFLREAIRSDQLVIVWLT
jgi:hypothetical protein